LNISGKEKIKVQKILREAFDCANWCDGSKWTKDDLDLQLSKFKDFKAEKSKELNRRISDKELFEAAYVRPPPNMPKTIKGFWDYVAPENRRKRGLAKLELMGGEGYDVLDAYDTACYSAAFRPQSINYSFEDVKRCLSYIEKLAERKSSELRCEITDRDIILAKYRGKLHPQRPNSVEAILKIYKENEAYAEYDMNSHKLLNRLEELNRLESPIEPIMEPIIFPGWTTHIREYLDIYEAGNNLTNMVFVLLKDGLYGEKIGLEDLYLIRPNTGFDYSIDVCDPVMLLQVPKLDIEFSVNKSRRTMIFMKKGIESKEFWRNQNAEGLMNNKDIWNVKLFSDCRFHVNPASPPTNGLKLEIRQFTDKDREALRLSKEDPDYDFRSCEKRDGHSRELLFSSPY